MKAITSLVLSAVFVATFVFSVVPPAAASGSTEPIKVGVLMMLTTPLAFYGKPQLEAIKMAVEAANAEGGVKGRKIELVVEDSAASNTTAVNGLSRILQSKPVAVIGPVLTTQNMAILPQIDKANIPLLNATAAPKMTQQGSQNVFRFGAHDTFVKEARTRFVVETFGKGKKIGIIHVANEWGYSGRDETASALDRFYKMKLASVASYQVTDKDMTGQIVQMQKDGVDVILVQGHPADETLIAKQMRQLKVEVPRVFSSSICIGFVRGIAEFKEVEGAYCEGPEMLPGYHSKPAVKEWATAFQKRAGTAAEGYDLHYYETARTLIAVMKQYGTSPDEIRKGLKEIKFQGLAAPYYSDKEGNMYHENVIMQFVPGETIRLVRRESDKR